jgi:ATP-dependent helicase/nuclease subunit B
MRERLGLPSPERRIGLSAHDFAQAASAPEVFLVHTERRGGQPTVKSRWLWRLETLLRGAGLSLPAGEEVEALVRGLDPTGVPQPADRPAPKPPVEARPRKLSVTRVETWVRDPYALYAEFVLGLEALPRPGERVGPRERGTALHAAFERFTLRHPGPLGPDAHDRFAELMIEALREAGVTEPDMAREITLARNAAPWAAEMERGRRGGCHRLEVEKRGVLELPELGFTLTAKTDRLEISDCGHVIDFKTGAPPTRKQVEQGLAPQLTLTAAILAAGGFAEVGPIPPGELLYIKITGRKEPGQIVCIAERDESQTMAAQALGRLQRLVARYQDSATPFVSRVRPKLERERGGDYDALARVWEWDVLAGAEDAEAEP